MILENFMTEKFETERKKSVSNMVLYASL